MALIAFVDLFASAIIICLNLTLLLSLFEATYLALQLIALETGFHSTHDLSIRMIEHNTIGKPI